METKPFLLPLVFVAQAMAVPVYVGTTAPTDDSIPGIYKVDFDPTTGALSKATLAAKYSSPVALALHPTQPILYAVGTPKVPFADDTTAIAAFQIQADHSLTFLAETSLGGHGAINLNIDATASVLAAPSPKDGFVSTIKLDDHGIPTKIVSLVKLEGSSANPKRQTSPHPHGVYFNQANTHLYVTDLGADRVFIYPFNATSGELGPALEPMKGQPGDGIRQMEFSTDDRFAYVLNELGNTVTIAEKNGDLLKPIGVVSTLPKDFDGKRNTTSEIEVHPNGNFVYTANRGHDSIAVFARTQKTGALELIQHTDVGGKFPCYLKIDPTAHWLLCANLISGNITSFPIDPISGKLGPKASETSIPRPLWLLFAR